VNPSAGECGVKDQVSRSGPSPGELLIPPLCVVGPTATGKTALGVALARALGDVELVSVDAMAVYRGLDIGTAKPTATERAGLCWHGLDLVAPEEVFSVAAFRVAVGAAREAISARGRRPLLVGGSGLYHRAIIDELEIPGRYPAIATELERRADTEGLGTLFAELAAADPLAASRIEPTNRRRIVRALEVVVGSGAPFSSYGPGLETYPASRYRIVGLRLDRPALDARIRARLAAQLEMGFVAEVEALARRPEGLSRTARQALGYRELLAYLDGETSLEGAIVTIERRTRVFARRQQAWFARDPRVHWLDADDPDLVARALALARLPELPAPHAMGE
jgi:tRNA dimethylallyltransferase